MKKEQQQESYEVGLAFNDQGLIPAIVQSAVDGQVLMMAWMNKEAYNKTIETGQAHFWSRSRQELWHKGATSGNIMLVQSIRLDCDLDTLLLKVEAAGPACHTGAVSCFYTQIVDPGVPAHPVSQTDNNDQIQPFNLEALYSILRDRQTNPRLGSYTNQLLSQGEDEIVKKIGEEAVEIILAAKGQGDQRLIEEIADLTYHILVLLVSRSLTPDDILGELARRHAK